MQPSTTPRIDQLEKDVIDLRAKLTEQALVIKSLLAWLDGQGGEAAPATTTIVNDQPSKAAPGSSRFDKKAYQRAYMAKKRASVLPF